MLYITASGLIYFITGSLYQLLTPSPVCILTQSRLPPPLGTISLFSVTELACFAVVVESMVFAFV